jgi:penicillin-binding protein 1A
LNTAFFGNNAYGIGAAAEVYFGKRVEELTEIEGAFLAGLVQAPSSYDPIRRPEFSQRRFEVVTQALVDTELLTEEERAAYITPDLPTTFELPDQAHSSLEGQEMPRTFYTEAVKDYLLNRSDILGATTQERFNRLFRGGLRIYTTFDPDIQLAGEQARETLPQNDKGVQTALITLDSKTAAVRSMVSGEDFQAGRNEINLTLNPRQTGSSIKMFILAAAIQAGAQANDLIDGPASCNLPNPGNLDEPVFEIRDAVGAGISTLERMTYDSINCAYSRLAQIVGLQRNVDSQLAAMDNPYLRARQSDPTLPDSKKVVPIASMATGGNEMSPLDMASGAQTIANYGVHHEPYYVELIESPQGRVYVHDDPGTQVFTADAAMRTIAVLKTVLGPNGTASGNQLEGGRAAAGKTGTQFKNTNAWFVGFTPELATAVWVGNPTQGNFEMTPRNLPEFGRNVQGGRFVAPIWKVAMDRAHAGIAPTDWTAPPPYPRPAARLYLPGTECIYNVVQRVVPGVPSAETVPPETGPDGLPVATEPTEPPPPIVQNELTPVKDANTTVPQDQTVNPTAPVPSIASGRQVSRCGQGGTVVAGSATTTTQPAGG